MDRIYDMFEWISMQAGSFLEDIYLIVVLL